MFLESVTIFVRKKISCTHHKKQVERGSLKTNYFFGEIQGVQVIVLDWLEFFFYFVKLKLMKKLTFIFWTTLPNGYNRTWSYMKIIK